MLREEAHYSHLYNKKARLRSWGPPILFSIFQKIMLKIRDIKGTM